MTKDDYLNEVRRELKIIFQTIKLCRKNDAKEKYRCEGFMKAGVFLGLVTNTELRSVMEQVHFEVFGQTIEGRAESRKHIWRESETDYSAYEVPTFLRPD